MRETPPPRGERSRPGAPEANPCLSFPVCAPEVGAGKGSLRCCPHSTACHLPGSRPRDPPREGPGRGGKPLAGGWGAGLTSAGSGSRGPAGLRVRAANGPAPRARRSLPRPRPEASGGRGGAPRGPAAHRSLDPPPRRSLTSGGGGAASLPAPPRSLAFRPGPCARRPLPGYLPPTPGPRSRACYLGPPPPAPPPRPWRGRESAGAEGSAAALANHRPSSVLARALIGPPGDSASTNGCRAPEGLSAPSS